MVVFIIACICILFWMVPHSVLIAGSALLMSCRVSGGKKESKLVETYIVGEKDHSGKYVGTGYDGKFLFSIYKNDEFISRTLKLGYLFEKYNVIEAYKWTKKGDTVIDVGANVGTFSIPMANHECRVIAFEPQSKIYDLLKQNIKQNKFINVDARHQCAGHTIGTAKLTDKIPDGSTEGKSLKESTPGDEPINYGGIQLGSDGEDCDMVTIDSLNLDSCALIKVDVEGAEPLVFYGAQKTIKKYSPVIIYEKTEKTVTNEMKEMFHLTDEISNFSILDFCMQQQYKTMIVLPGNNFMLLKHAIDTHNYTRATNNTKYPSLKVFSIIRSRWK